MTMSDYQGRGPDPDGPEPDEPHTIAIGVADEEVERAGEGVKFAERRVAEAERESRSAQMDLAHRRARLAAAEHVRQALAEAESPLVIRGLGTIRAGDITRDLTLDAGVISEGPIESGPGYARQLEEALDALNEQASAIQATIDSIRASGVPPLDGMTDYQITDHNGRPLLLDVTVARATVLATLARLGQ